MAETIETLPVVPANKPLIEWTAGELLSQLSRLALMRAIQLIEPDVRDPWDPKDQRRVEIGGNLGIKTLARIQAERMRIEAGQTALIEYEQAVARQERLLGLRPLPADGSKYKPKKAKSGSKEVTGDPA